MRNKTSCELIQIDGLEAHLFRKKVKNLTLRVKPPDGHLEISAPLRFPLSDIESFVISKRKWIERKREEIARSPQSIAASASKEDIEQWRSLIKAFAPLLIEKWEPIIGVKSSKLDYRNMKSRWGSCQPSTGRICLNIRLALYPPECLEYVVVHELCHLRERGHGPAFKALMDSYLPNWKAIRKKLN